MAQKQIPATPTIVPLTRHELHGMSIGEDSAGLSFGHTAARNVSEASNGYLQGWEENVTATLAEGWTWLPADYFKEKCWGPGLEGPDGEIYRNSIPGQNANDAYRAGAFVVLP